MGLAGSVSKESLTLPASFEINSFHCCYRLLLRPSAAAAAAALPSPQADVAQMLLERLPEFCDPQGEEAQLPQLILGQLRWWVLHLIPKPCKVVCLLLGRQERCRCDRSAQQLG